MTTRLSKPITRLTSISGAEWNVTLDYSGVTFRPYRGRTQLLLPYPMALTRAAWIAGERDKRKKKVRRSKV